MDTSKLEKDLELFQLAVQKLSQSIRDASSLWNDPKFSELSSSIGEIANQSVEVMNAGQKVSQYIASFEKVSQEKY